MQSQNWFLSRIIAVAMVTVLVVSLTSLAVAQISAEREAAFASAPKIPTSVPGVYAFTAPPKGFNPLTASNSELWQYGLPERPDKAVDPKHYAVWERAMLALKTSANDVKASTIVHGPMKPAGAVPEGISNVPTSATSYNWSGIANTNKLKAWNKKTSFDVVYSVWNVPNGRPPFSYSCSQGPEWIVSTWNGIDGWNNNDVIQGGTNSGYSCSTGYFYTGWVEWYPSYPELVIVCGSSACPVNAGDDFYAITYGVAGTATQTVFVEDLTTQWHITASLTWVSGPGVVGSSAEYINERPCCVTVNKVSYFYPLANYIFDFFDYSYAYDVYGTLFYPGATTAATYNVSMLADNGTTISTVEAGTAGFQGRYSLWFADEGCANSGGCAY